MGAMTGAITGAMMGAARVAAMMSAISSTRPRDSSAPASVISCWFGFARKSGGNKAGA
jgi:hypothetical protein